VPLPLVILIIIVVIGRLAPRVIAPCRGGTIDHFPAGIANRVTRRCIRRAAEARSMQIDAGGIHDQHRGADNFTVARHLSSALGG
jgi:hypothetical protein